jgi:hypothetical protein
VAKKAAPSFMAETPGDGVDEIELDDSPLFASQQVPEPAPVSSIDLFGKPRLVFVAGLGKAGKTTLCRWIGERTRQRENAVLASVDPVNRELGLFFPETFRPETRDPGGIARWLADFVASAVKKKATAVVDLGGGDASFAKLFAETPGLAGQIEAEGVALVSLYVLSGRSIELTVLNDMERHGFQPPCTAVVLNHAVLNIGETHEAAFRRTTSHRAYRTIIGRGAIPIWMPHLYGADEIAERRILFEHAKDGVMPEGRAGLPLGPQGRSRTAAWLDAMTKAFAPIDRWIP